MNRLVGVFWCWAGLGAKNCYDTALFWKIDVSKLVNWIIYGEAVVKDRLIV